MSLHPILYLMRPVNSLMVGFAVVVGVTVASPMEVFSLNSLLGFLTGFLISSYSMVVNDLYDLEVDLVNRPDRPLPSGRVDFSSAVVASLIMLVCGLLTACVISLLSFVIALSFAALAWIYSFWGKRKGLLGNMMVAASVSVPYVFGGAAVGRLDHLLIWFLALTSFIAAVGREVVKTVSDVEGDKVRDVRSIALTRGERFAARLGGSLFSAAVLSTILPLLAGVSGLVFGLLVLIPDAIFVYASIMILRDWSHGNALKVKKLSLVGMMLGLAAFTAGGVWRC